MDRTEVCLPFLFCCLKVKKQVSSGQGLCAFNGHIAEIVNRNIWASGPSSGADGGAG